MSQSSDQPTSPEPGYETRDASASGVVKFGLALVALTALSMLGLVWFWGLISEPESASRAVAPPGPPLLPDPVAEFNDIRSQEEALLTGYGWVDRQRGVARIPIERAMKILAEQSAGKESAPPDESNPEPAP